MASPRDVWKTNGGVYLGYKVEEDGDRPPPLPKGKWEHLGEQYRYFGERHVITLGPNGSGKSRRLLMPNLVMLTDWSIVVVDPKGELAAATALHREAKGNKVIVIDPFAVIAENYPALLQRSDIFRSAGCNPIAALDPNSQDFADDAKALAEAIVKVEQEREKHWAESARTLVAGLIMADRVTAKGPSSLPALRDYVSREATVLSAIIAKEILTKVKDWPAIGAKLNRFSRIDPESRELLSILSTAVTQTDWLDSDPIQDDLEKDIHDFAAMKRKPTTVYLVLPPRYLETHATWLRLMLTAILTPLMRTTGTDVPILFMLDEFAQLGRLEVIERNMAMMRGYGIKLWPVFQDLSQAKDAYAQRWESFIGNAGRVQCFAPQDKTTRDYLSDLSGKWVYWFDTLSTGRSNTYGRDSSHGKSEQTGQTPIQGPVWYPEHLARIQGGQGVLFSQGYLSRAVFPQPEEIAEVGQVIGVAAATARAAE